MAFNYKKYKEAQYSSPVKQKTTLSKLNKARKAIGLTPVGFGWLGLEMGAQALYDFDFLGFKSHMNRPKGSGSGGSWKPETKKEKEKRESKEGKVVKGGTQRFKGVID